MSDAKLLLKIRSGSVANVRFQDIRRLAEALGFDLRRISGSHHVYKHPDIAQKLNLQPLKNGDAKPYQVRQLVRLIEEYDLKLEEEST